jgi:predicted O-methyltransferase YrrM
MSDSGQYDFEYCPVLAELIRSHRIIGKNGKVFEQLNALSSRNNLLMLRQLILTANPHRTVEIGLGFGGSALVFAATHRDLNHEPCAQHVCIDPFQTTVWDSSALVLLESAGLSSYVDFRSISSALELPRMFETGDRFDLAYIDGSHLFEDVFVDFYYISRLLSENGVVTFDDSTNPHVRKVLQFIRSNLSSAFAEMDLTPYRSEDKKSLKYRIARFLNKTQMTAFRRVGAHCREWDAEFVDF